MYFNPEDLQKLKKKVLEVTREAQTPTKKEASAFKKELEFAYVAADLGCKAAGVHGILSAILRAVTNETFTPNTGSGAPMLYSACVPLEKKGGHNYTVDVPFIVFQSSNGQAVGGFRKNGTEPGNALCGRWRYATESEIEEFFAAQTLAGDLLPF